MHRHNSAPANVPKVETVAKEPEVVRQVVQVDTKQLGQKWESGMTMAPYTRVQLLPGEDVEDFQ